MEPLQKSEIMGRDISAPIDTMELDGKVYRLRHDLNSFRIAEDVYDIHYGRNVSFGVIAQHLAAGRIGAIMAVLYGAISAASIEAGNMPMTWPVFFTKFKLTDIPGFDDELRKQLMKNVQRALPEVTGEKADKGDPQ